MPRSIEQMVLAYLTERRLLDTEAAAVVKALKTDSRFTYLEGRWEMDEDLLSPTLTGALILVVRNKVLTWMDKYREKHPARALFTGVS